MLAQLRNLTRGFVAWVLLALLALAFTIWGVPSFNNAVSPHVAEVDGRGIKPAELSREMDLTLRGERSRGNNVSQQDAIEAGLHMRLLEGMIGRYAMLSYAEKVGVSASNVLVANRIREIPSVQNAVGGGFDEAAYQQFLDQLGYAQGDFEEEIRGEITTQMLLSAMVAGVRPPGSFGALAFAFEAETRVISVAEAPASLVGAIAAPTEAQLQAFWEENADRLRVPEFRALTFVYARPQDFIARVDVPEARLREEFEARRPALTRPERRSYVRLAAQTEAQAADAAARLARGESIEAVASALSLQVSRGENQTRDEVPDASVAEAVFTMQPQTPARAVRGRLTPWAVVSVQNVTPAIEPSFQVVSSDLRQAIAADEAADLLNAAIGTFEEARAGGAAVADAARQAGLSVLVVPAVEASGRTQEGAPVEALAGHEEALRAAFETPEGEASDFLPVGDADVLVSVDRIIPESVRPLAEVRTDLIAAWTGRERARLLREIGGQFIASVRDGASFAEAARTHRFALRLRSVETNREGVQQIPASGLPEQIFAASEGDVVSATAPNGAAILVAQVERINRPDPAEAQAEVEAYRAQFQQGLAGSVAEAVQSQILAQARITRNTAVIERSFNTGGQDEETQ